MSTKFSYKFNLQEVSHQSRHIYRQAKHKLFKLIVLYTNLNFYFRLTNIFGSHH